MKRSDFLLFFCLILCALAVVHTQHRARRIFVDLEREKTIGDELSADLRRLQAERAALAASNRVEHVASDMKLRLPDNKSVIVMRAPTQEVADASDSRALALTVLASQEAPDILPDPPSVSTNAQSPKAKQAVHLAKKDKR